jgi:hypothetical protein
LTNVETKATLQLRCVKINPLGAANREATENAAMQVTAFLSR